MAAQVQQRCVYIEGIGRVHVLGPPGDEHVAVMDGPQNFRRAIRAADIIAGDAPGRIIWSVRFQEKE